MSDSDETYRRLWAVMNGDDNTDILRALLRSIVMAAGDNGMSNPEIAAELERLASVLKTIEHVINVKHRQ